MGKGLYPDIYLSSIYNIDLDFLKDKGISSIIIDIDNTLSPWGSIKPEERTCHLIECIRNKGFKICILSNSSMRRIKKYCLNLDVIYGVNVRKPLKQAFIKAMELMDSNVEDTCVIGDQLFTDILGGNSCGLFTILVAPIDKNEFILTRIIRRFEKRILDKYLHN